jgi:hypothetical protein
MENGKTKETLVVKTMAFHRVALRPYKGQKMALISRYPSNSENKWIEANEKEAMEWNFDKQCRKINLQNPIKNAIT